MLEELSHVELDDLLEVGMKKYEKRLLKYIVRHPLQKKQKLRTSKKTNRGKKKLNNIFIIFSM